MPDITMKATKGSQNKDSTLSTNGDKIKQLLQHLLTLDYTDYCSKHFISMVKGIINIEDDCQYKQIVIGLKGCSLLCKKNENKEIFTAIIETFRDTRKTKKMKQILAKQQKINENSVKSQSIVEQNKITQYSMNKIQNPTIVPKIQQQLKPKSEKQKSQQRKILIKQKIESFDQEQQGKIFGKYFRKKFQATIKSIQFGLILSLTVISLVPQKQRGIIEWGLVFSLNPIGFQVLEVIVKCIRQLFIKLDWIPKAECCLGELIITTYIQEILLKKIVKISKLKIET